jgi:hypothetical protein
MQVTGGRAGCAVWNALGMEGSWTAVVRKVTCDHVTVTVIHSETLTLGDLVPGIKLFTNHILNEFFMTHDQ